jgi:flagellar biosynthetic protein FlhB
MADPHKGDRTEKPSPKRLKDARKRGQVATSRDLALAAGSLAATGVLVAGGTQVLRQLEIQVENGLRTFASAPLRDLAVEDLMPIIAHGGLLLALTAGPIALAAAATGALAMVAQSGFNVSTGALSLNWQRLSPATGLGRLAPARAGVDTLKTIATCTVLAFLAWRVANDLLRDSSRLTWTAPIGSARVGWEIGIRMLWQMGFALLAIGAIDFGIQRWRLWSSLKMTRQEVQDEAKSTDGNPQIKARVRRIQRDMVRRRMLHAVPGATVVLTNPTHFAVALEYRRERSAAPVVVAKGRDLVAARIREIAREHSVPIVENPPLARALFQDCEVGDMIPGPLFGAVAEVLAYLIRIKQLVL